MRIFVTGATGYIGGAAVDALKQAGHAVCGLARSAASKQKLLAAGVEAIDGDLNHPESLKKAAASADGVIHAAMAWGPDTPKLDEQSVRAILEGLAGVNRPFVYTSGVWVVGDTKGRTVGEMAVLRPAPLVAWRPAVENLVLAADGVRGIVIRPGMVYGRGGGFLSGFVHQAKQGGPVKIVGSGENHWSLVHVNALADLYVLALEKSAGSEVYVAVDCDPVPVKKLAAATGVPVESMTLEEARQTLGPVADAVAMDQKVLSTKAGRVLGWNPRYPSPLDEIRAAMTPS